MYIDKRIIFIIIIIMVATTAFNLLTQPGQLLSLLLTIPGVLIAITFHEFAHAFAADRLGDDTPRMQGRLSLNPLAHLDPIGSLMLLFAGFGWGKPVQINPRNFNRKFSMTAGEAIVAVAGPVMNFLLAILLTVIYCIIYKFAGLFMLTQVGMIIVTIIQLAIVINIGLGVFNLIPIPPLDGSKVLKNFLPYNARTWFENRSYIFYIVFVVLWAVGILGLIITPVTNVISNFLINIIGRLFGLY